MAAPTEQGKFKGDGPSNADSDEAANNFSEGRDDEYPLVEQQNADLIQADTRPNEELESERCLIKVTDRVH